MHYVNDKVQVLSNRQNCTKNFKDDVSTGEVKEALGNIYRLAGYA